MDGLEEKMEETKVGYRWVIEIMVYLGSLALGMVWYSIGPMLLTLTEELQITMTQAGLLTGAIALVLGIFALISGTVSGRIGLKLTACLGIAMMALGGIISGVLPNYPLILTGRILFAVGAGMFFPMIGAIIMQWFSGRELLIVNSINFSGMTAGIAIGLLITTPLIEALGWQMTLMVYGALCALFAILYWPLLKERGPAVAIHDEVPDRSQEPPLEEEHEVKAYDVLKMKETWLLAFSFLAPNSAAVAMGTFLPAYYVKEKGMTMAVASSWTSIIFFIGVPAAIVGGIWAAKAGLRRPFLIYDGIILGIGCLGSVFFSGPLLLVFLALTGIGLLFYTGIFFTIPMELPGMSPKVAGFMMGIIIFIGMEGGFITPIIIGSMETMSGSLKSGLLLFSLLSFLMAILPIFIKETGPKAKKREIL
jgi:cyanate permease